MNYDLTDSEFYKICEVIAVRLGLHFPVERRAMLGRNLASAACEFGFQSMNGFIQWLLSSEPNQDQIKILASHLTISETYFWREPQVFNALTDHILPELIGSKKKGEKSLRIWSAGCSTGEEPYSVAIALHKTLPKIKDWNIKILATDINPKSINKAGLGIYGPWSFRNTPQWLTDRYFLTLEDRKFEIIPEIKKMVTFSCLSLTHDDIYSAIGDKMDIIFCRNVLMYFTPEWVTRISQNLFHSLSEDGWFIVSSSEMSSQVFPQFTAVNFPGAVLYNKAKNGHDHKLSSISFPKEKIQPLKHSTLSPLLPFTPSPVHHLQSIQPSSTFQPVQPLIPSPCHPIPPSDIQQPQTAPEEFTKIFAIRHLADQGYLSEALFLCNNAISTEKLGLAFYFMRASILQEMGKRDEAIASLKKAIYIDQNYIMGHFTLGNLFSQEGNIKNAKRYFNNTLNLLSKYPNDDILPETEGLSVKYIREIILAKMETQQTK